MYQSLDVLKKQFQQELQQAQCTADLEQLKVKYLGRKGPIQDLMKGLKEVAPEEKPRFGKEINDLKGMIEGEIATKSALYVEDEEKDQLSKEAIDVTLPGRRHRVGRKHPITQMLDRLIEILSKMGFSVQYGPDIDTDYYNFEVLNFAPDHPARDMQDTFYIAPNVLLRTHTSNVQARVMENNEPPIRIVAPGKVYRNEAITARSHVFFHQIEGFYVDKNVSFADLFATMEEFLSKLFEQAVQLRFRPSYFPFVEPGVEIDVGCLLCKGKGCSMCKGTGWLEIAGAGLIHQEVLKNGGIDPEVYSGYAWGMGIERLVILMHGVDDIRLFTENDLRFLSQFKG